MTSDRLTSAGLTWSKQTVIQLADPAANQTEPWGGGNRTFGGGLASGIALQGGPHKVSDFLARFSPF